MLNGASVGIKTAVSYGYWFLCIASLGAFLLFPFIVNPYFRQYIFFDWDWVGDCPNHPGHVFSGR